jgi:HAD superfamily hydrolase (TIGR01509 family)
LILELGKINASQEDKDKWLQQKNEDYLTYLTDMDYSEILPGVTPILQFLKEHHQPIALGSASKNARPILEKTGIISYFDVIVDGNDVTNAKPDPEVFVQAAKLLGVDNKDAIVFEDSVAGVQAANNAGMTSVGIGNENILHEAKYIFKDFTYMDTSFLEALLKNKSSSTHNQSALIEKKMNQDYIKPDNWSVIEEGFDAERVKSSESLFSIGNGAMGQRANFEETYTGETFQGSYIAGIYYPDKTKVGWWKNGYPEYFAKVLNAPNWIGIDIEINGDARFEYD